MVVGFPLFLAPRAFSWEMSSQKLPCIPVVEKVLPLCNLLNSRDGWSGGHPGHWSLGFADTFSLSGPSSSGGFS